MGPMYEKDASYIMGSSGLQMATCRGKTCKQIIETPVFAQQGSRNSLHHLGGTSKQRDLHSAKHIKLPAVAKSVEGMYQRICLQSMNVLFADF